MRRDGPAFLEGALYLRTQDGQLLRHICEDPEGGQALFLKVALQWDKTPKLAIAIPIDDAYELLDNGGLATTGDLEIKPGFMKDSDEKIRRDEYERTGFIPLRPGMAAPPVGEAQAKAAVSQTSAGAHGPDAEMGGRTGAGDAGSVACETAAKDVEDPSPASGRAYDPCRMIRTRDDAWELIEPLVSTPAQLRATYNPRTCTAVLQKQAKKLKVPLIKLQRLVHKYAWFGLTKNALLPLDALKGPSRHVPSKPGEPKRGRPNAAALVGLPASLHGVNVTQFDIKLFIRALKEYWTRDDESLEATYALMVHNLYVAKTRINGELTTFQIRRSKIPTIEQFRWHARILIGELGLDDGKQGRVDAMKTATDPGRDTDIAKNVGDVFDIDATEFNRELVADFLVRGRTVNIGKPIVVLVFDRRSKKVVGWHVYIGRENWKQGYRLALLSAMTGKQERLAHLGIHLKAGYIPWLVNIKPRHLYADNGPVVSHDGMNALQLLDIGLWPAPPEMPPWKPAVEGGLGNFQSKHASLSGGYRRTRRARDRKRRRYAKLLADKTLFQFEQLLVLQIIDYNARLDMEQLLTVDQKKEGIGAGPDAVFMDGVSRRGGLRHRTCNRNDVIRALMRHHRSKRLTRWGVRIREHRAYYNCAALEKAFDRGVRRVDVMSHPTDPMQVTWSPDEGQEIALERSADGDKDYGNWSKIDIDMYHLHNKVEVIKRRRARNRVLTRRQSDLLLKRTGRPQLKQRTAPTPHIDETRRLQAAIHLRTDPANLESAPSAVPAQVIPARTATPPLPASGMPAAGGSPAKPSPTPAPLETVQRRAIDPVSSVDRWDAED